MHACGIWKDTRVPMLSLHRESHRKGRDAGAETSAVAVRVVSISLRLGAGQEAKFDALNCRYRGTGLSTDVVDTKLGGH